ncbi:MAG: OmpA family protein [Candidatus Phaeomarinobacter sp.]
MTYQNAALSLPSLAVVLTAGLVFVSLADRAHAQESADVSVNLDALGLNNAQDAQSQPQLILKYPGSSTATRQVPQLRYPNVPAPTARPTPPTAASAAEPAIVAAKPSNTTPAKPSPAPTKPDTKPIVATPVKPEPAQQDPVAEPKPVERKTESAAVTPAAPAPEPTPEPKAEPSPEPAPDTAPAPEPAVSAAPAPKPPVEAAPSQPEPEAQVAALSPPAPVAELPDPAPSILQVIFDEQTAAIIGSARKDLDAIGETLRYDPRRIELKAYGGTPGDKASEARRISLKRGLAVRAYLIGLGIDSRRIDVRALGGVTDTGAPDRVDVAYSGT